MGYKDIFVTLLVIYVLKIIELIKSQSINYDKNCRDYYLNNSNFSREELHTYRIHVFIFTMHANMKRKIKFFNLCRPFARSSTERLHCFKAALYFTLTLLILGARYLQIRINGTQKHRCFNKMYRRHLNKSAPLNKASRKMQKNLNNST